MTKTLDNIKSTILLKESINDILKSASLKVGVKRICDKYIQLLESGKRSEEIAQGFVNEMQKFASLTSVNTTLNELQRSIDNKNNRNNNAMICEMQSLRYSNPQTFSIVEEKVVDYLTNKTNESAESLKTSLNLFRGCKEVDAILECMQVDVYAKALGQNVVKAELNESEIHETVYTKDQVDEMIKNAVSESKKMDEEKRALEANKSIYSLEDKTGLVESINRILAKESRNKKVKDICKQYKSQIKNGINPAVLCESFISTMGPFGYLNAVDTELAAINGKISKYKQEIDLIKILETMKTTTSYYIVPIIESYVVDYVNNKCMPTRVMLCQICENFKSDPFVKDILYVINSDQSVDNLFLGRTLEVSESVKTSKTFSPAQYVNENCFIFNAFGNYYQKKGGSVLKLHKDEIQKLDESFKHVCECINSKGVTYDFATDTINITAQTSNHTATINESGAINIDGNAVELSEIKKDEFLRYATYEGSKEFYDKVISLAECNTLFTVDFAKRASLNESNKSVDVFRIGDKISISLNEGANSQFRSNINPLKFKKYVNEHMQLKIDEAFEDIMPNQKLLESSINDAKDAYESYLQTLQDSKNELLQMKESGEAENEAEIDAMIGALDKEIEDITKNYKEVQKDADDLLSIEDDIKDSDEKDQDDNGDIDEPATDDLKQQVSEPLSSTESPNDGETTSTPIDSPEPLKDDDFDPYEDIVSDTPEFDPVLDTPAYFEDETNNEDAIKVQDVSFERNVKSNKVSNKGTVTILIPTVNSNGDVKNEIKTVTFTLDSNRNPIINNEYMPLYIYNTIVDAIKKCPDTEKVDVNAGVSDFGKEDLSTTTTTDAVSSTDTDSDDLLGMDTSITPDFGDDEVISSPTTDNTTTQDDSTKPLTGLDNPLNGIDDKQEQNDDIAPEDESINDPIFKGDKAFKNIGNYPFDFVLAEEDIVLANQQEVSKVDSFKKYLDLHNIEYTNVVQKDEDGRDIKCIKMHIKDKGQVDLIEKAIVRGLGYTKKVLLDAFPELRSVIGESLNVPRASKIFEAIDREPICVEFPHDDGLMDTLRSSGFNVEKTDMDSVTIDVPGQYTMLMDVVERFVNETDDLPKSYIDDVKERLERYRIDGGIVKAQPSSGLEYALDKDGIDYTEDADGINIPVKTLESAKTLLGLSKRYRFIGESVDKLKDIISLNEGILITIEDTETHKKITVDTDDLEKEGKSDDNGDSEKEDNTSFDNDTELFNSKEDADAAKSADNQPNSAQQSESVTDKPVTKKKFKFTSKKTNESATAYPEITSGSKVIYTDAKGNKFNADVTGVRDGGKLILIVQGHTVVADRSKVKLHPLTNRIDPTISNISLQTK